MEQLAAANPARLRAGPASAGPATILDERSIMAGSRGTVLGVTACGRVVAVVVTFDRPLLLARCLAALRAQCRPPEAIIVMDDAGPGRDTAAVVATFPGVYHLRHADNLGGAAAYRSGIEAAMRLGADGVWLMDDDGYPADDSCLDRLARTLGNDAGIAAPLVLDEADRAHLAFPIRLSGRTRFLRKEVTDRPCIDGFAHLFNGALLRASVFAEVGLPDPRFVCRGDEVEFLLRVLQARIPVRLDTTAHFLHPGSGPEIHPILFGAFYAVVPATASKRHHQFRNRGYIFPRYGLWRYVAADVLRYGCHYLLRRRPDPRGFRDWLRLTAAGWTGGFMRMPVPPRPHLIPQPSADTVWPATVALDTHEVPPGNEIEPRDATSLARRVATAGRGGALPRDAMKST